MLLMGLELIAAWPAAFLEIEAVICKTGLLWFPSNYCQPGLQTVQAVARLDANVGDLLHAMSAPLFGEH